MKNLFFILLCINLLFFSCRKKSGLGGKATVHVHVINGNANMPFIDVHVAFNGTSYPGSIAIGDLVITADQKGMADFIDLKRGTYYFYVNATINDTLYPGGEKVNVESKKGEQHVVIDLAEEYPL